MPGALAHALFVRPIESFARFWPQVIAKARGQKTQLAVVGAGAAGLELAIAAAHALGSPAGAAGTRVTLVTGGQAPGASFPAATQRRIAKALARLRVDVLEDACVGIESDEIRLASGARLACDLPLLAVGAQAPAWLAASGLALDGQGFMQVNAFQQSTSHAAVFAAGDVASRMDAPHAKSGVYAVRAGPPLLANLLSALNGQPLAPYRPQKRTLYLLSCGSQQAIAVWGGFSVQGAWVWRWKNSIDRRFVATYAT
jgi:NADH dehydrogenase FAD-containing subunit